MSKLLHMEIFFPTIAGGVTAQKNEVFRNK